MRVRVLKSLVAAVAMLASVVAGSATAQSRTGPPHEGPRAHAAGEDRARGLTSERVCPDMHEPGRAYCLAMVPGNGQAAKHLRGGQAPSGYGPQDIRSAYHLPTGGAGRTVAVTIAYHHPNLEKDLSVFRSQFGLTPCTKANGCLRVISQRGGTDLPTTTDPGWAFE